MSFVFDPFSHEIHEDPYPVYRVLRDEHPVHHDAARDVWALSRFADVQAAARDWRGLSNADGVDLDATGRQYSAGNFLDMDPPRHDALRDVVRHRFAPKEIKALEAMVARELTPLLEDLRDAGGGDAVELLAGPLPVAVMCELLGVPAADRPLLARWTRDEVARECGTAELPQAALDAVAAMRDYFASLLAAQRDGDEPGMAALIAGALARGELASEQKAVDMCLLLVTAGTETTAALLASALLTLDRHRDARRRLLAGEVALDPALEELLRCESPIQMLARTATTDTTLHGRTIPQGARVLLVYGAANRDERRFADPDRLDLGRERLRNLAFGEGIHHCLGAPLARLEGRVALGAFLRAFPDYAVDGTPLYQHKHNGRALAHLPLSVAA